jgi:hypothetical protein
VNLFTGDHATVTAPGREHLPESRATAAGPRERAKFSPVTTHQFTNA